MNGLGDFIKMYMCSKKAGRGGGSVFGYLYSKCIVNLASKLSKRCLSTSIFWVNLDLDI
jgi:hypothetical protein